jgi:uncharacterized phage-associated protein
MPAWSPEIANEFIKLAATQERALDQLQLQGLVYIAHGWCLGFHGEPLTGDRPEAWEFGPIYRRLAEALAPYGCDHVTREISRGEAFPNDPVRDIDQPARADLDEVEQELISDTFLRYSRFEASQLSALTRKGDTPWRQVFANGSGEFSDIPHQMVKAQFDELLRQSEGWQESS